MTDLEHFIEEVGLFYEYYGLPRMAGRILGFLLATPRENESFESIVKQLKASKGSISGNINTLLQLQLIKKTMITGDRKSYYTFSIDNYCKILDERIHKTRQIKELLKKARKLHEGSTAEKARQMDMLIDFYRYMEQELPMLQQRWAEKWKK